MIHANKTSLEHDGEAPHSGASITSSDIGPKSPSQQSPARHSAGATLARLGVTLIGALALACSGAIGDPGLPGQAPSGSGGGGAGGGGSSGGGGGIGSSKQPVCGRLAPAPLRRLTRAEYNNTLRDVVGITTNPGTAFPPDEHIAGFEVGTAVTPLLAEKYVTTAEAITKNLDVKPLLSCDPVAVGEDACARTFISEMGLKLYRRVLTTAEVDRLHGVYVAGKAQGGFTVGVRWALQTMLQSPNFIYRVQLGTPANDDKSVAGSLKLTHHEMAARLSYMLWNSAPDAKLLAAAAAKKLHDPDELAAQARRLLSDPRARAGVRNFFRQWLHLERLDAIDKDKSIFPDWSPTLAHAMRDETLRFAEHVVFDGDGLLSTLFTAKYSFINADLAKIYGVQNVSGSELARADLDASQRAGILTHASMMAINANSNQSSPVYRGHFVRSQILCDPPAPPPDNLVVKPPDLDPKLSTRQRFDQHRTDPACKGCHQMMDPIGFGFENYDGIGAYRTEEAPGITVDSSGELFGTVDADGKFTGAIELSQRLAKSAQVRQCVVKQWFRYTFGRNETEADACTLSQLNSAFAASGYNLRDLFIATVRSEAFQYRKGGIKGLSK